MNLIDICSVFSLGVTLTAERWAARKGVVDRVAGQAEPAGRLILPAFRGRVTPCLPLAVLPGLACELRRDQSGLPYGFVGDR